MAGLGTFTNRLNQARSELDTLLECSFPLGDILLAYAEELKWNDRSEREQTRKERILLYSMADALGATGGSVAIGRGVRRTRGIRNALDEE